MKKTKKLEEIVVPRSPDVDSFRPDPIELIIPVTEDAKDRLSKELSFEDDVFPKKRKRRRSSEEVKKSRMYWNEQTEKYIIKYKNSKSQAERNKIYLKYLKFPFEKLVENVFNTFKFSYVESGSKNAQSECVSHLITIIEKFDETVGSGKSFGYFSIVAKHFFILVNNGNYNKWKMHSSIENEFEKNNEIVYTDNFQKNRENSEFVKLMVKYWDENITKTFSKKKDIEIASAIIELFRKSDRIDCFNKKSLYLYVREISGCKTQNITKIINKMKFSQNSIMKNYRNIGKINSYKNHFDEQSDDE